MIGASSFCFFAAQPSQTQTKDKRKSVRLSIRLSATLLGCLVCVICKLRQKFPFLYNQTLHNDWSHIEEEHLLFCAHLINIFSFLWVLNLDIFFRSEMSRGCLVCVICYSNSYHSFIFKLCILIIHTLKMCTSSLCTFDKIFLIFYGC